MAQILTHKKPDPEPNPFNDLDVMIGLDRNAIQLMDKAPHQNSRLVLNPLNHDISYLNQALELFQANFEKLSGVKTVHLANESWDTVAQKRGAEERQINKAFDLFMRDEINETGLRALLPAGSEFRMELQVGLAQILRKSDVEVKMHILHGGNKSQVDIVRQAKEHQFDIRQSLHQLTDESAESLIAQKIYRDKIDARVLSKIGQLISHAVLELNNNRNNTMSGQLNDIYSKLQPGEVCFAFFGAAHLGLMPPLLSNKDVSFVFTCLPTLVLNDLPPSYRNSFAASALSQAAVKATAEHDLDIIDLKNVLAEYLLTAALQVIVNQMPNCSSPESQAYSIPDVAAFYAGLIRRSLRDPQQLYDLIKTSVDEAYTTKRNMPLIEVVVVKFMNDPLLGLDFSAQDPADFYRQIARRVWEPLRI